MEKINWSYVVLAIALAALWALRRIGMDDITSDTIVSALVLAVGVSPSVVRKGSVRLPKVPPVAVLALALFVAGCATTTLRDCTMEISRSSPDKDRMVCAGHDPIVLKNLDPKVRELVLKHLGTPAGEEK